MFLSVPMIARIKKPCMVIFFDILDTSTHHDLVPLTYISCSTDIDRTLCRVNTNVSFFVKMKARIMKPYIVIVLEILYKHTP